MMRSFAQFASSCALAALMASTALANSVLLHSVDHLDRTVTFTPHSYCEGLEPVFVPGGHSIWKHNIPHGWGGMIMAALPGGIHPIHRVIAEVQFQGFEGQAHFDISAVDNHMDDTGVHWMYPLGVELTRYLKPGCDHFPCDNCYLIWNDKHNRVTEKTEFVIEIGQLLGVGIYRYSGPEKSLVVFGVLWLDLVDLADLVDLVDLDGSHGCIADLGFGIWNEYDRCD
ncbi:DNase1 protein [Sclerotinia borealis F-4128]|uniref:DNase1 protein n=1 Tax=Sclerotinia borealis (strain F-4128) TaxID=1432307 RepID=W9C0X0_SCLBF|nr:DNase1 protein [Sclerotinia borealis F-4128]